MPMNSTGFLVIKKPEDLQEFELDFQTDPWFVTSRHTTKGILDFSDKLGKHLTGQEKKNFDEFYGVSKERIIPHEDSLEIIPFFIFTKEFNGKRYYLTHKYKHYDKTKTSNVFSYHPSDNSSFSRQHEYHLPRKTMVFADAIFEIDETKTIAENMSDNVYTRLKDLVIPAKSFTVEDLVKDLAITIRPFGTNSNATSFILGLGWTIDLTLHNLNSDSETLKGLDLKWMDQFSLRTEVIVDSMLNPSHLPNITTFTFDKWTHKIVEEVF